MLLAQSCPTLCNCRLPASSVHGILQARILEWVAIPFSRGSSWSTIKPGSPVLQADSLPSEPPGKPQEERLPWPGNKPWPQRWGHLFLTTRPPSEKSLCSFIDWGKKILWHRYQLLINFTVPELVQSWWLFLTLIDLFYDLVLCEDNIALWDKHAKRRMAVRAPLLDLDSRAGKLVSLNFLLGIIYYLLKSQLPNGIKKIISHHSPHGSWNDVSELMRLWLI